MKVNLAESAGFCSGVRRALKMARSAAARGERVLMLGELVHNEDVLHDMDALGIERVSEPGEARDATLLICAHGVPLETMERARNSGCRIVDATCPMVREIHKAAAAFEAEGRTVIVIGDEDHDEVRGIVGQLSRGAIVISDQASVPDAELDQVDNAGVVVQSTQNIADVERVLAHIRKHVADVVFKNTICRPTSRKQKEIAEMAAENDVMVIIGSRTSANTKRLYELSSAVNPKTHWVRDSGELLDEWFHGAASVGVGAGASTPDKTTDAVIEYLNNLDSRKDREK